MQVKFTVFFVSKKVEFFNVVTIKRDTPKPLNIPNTTKKINNSMESTEIRDKAAIIACELGYLGLTLMKKRIPNPQPPSPPA